MKPHVNRRAIGPSNLALLSTLAIAGVGIASPATAATFIGPTAYLSAADSPFAGLGLSNFQLEDFEDSAFNVPGATPSPGWIVPGVSLLDSVDGDDGNINGFSQGAKSYYSNFATDTLKVTFAAGPNGLPTHAGIVWTDVGYVGGSQTCKGDVVLEAWGPGGVYLGSTGPHWLGDGKFNGETPEDRFLGVINAAGISAISLWMPDSKDFEVDHVQFGTQVVPAPGVGALGIAAIGLGLRRRRS